MEPKFWKPPQGPKQVLFATSGPEVATIYVLTALGLSISTTKPGSGWLREELQRPDSWNMTVLQPSAKSRRRSRHKSSYIQVPTFSEPTVV